MGVGDQSRCARRKVVAGALGPVADGRRVEQHQVGVPAGRDPAAFGQPVEPGRHVGDQSDRFLERHHLVFADAPCPSSAVV